jgi:hypothetical protein
MRQTIRTVIDHAKLIAVRYAQIYLSQLHEEQLQQEAMRLTQLHQAPSDQAQLHAEQMDEEQMDEEMQEVRHAVGIYINVPEQHALWNTRLRDMTMPQLHRTQDQLYDALIEGFRAVPVRDAGIRDDMVQAVIGVVVPQAIRIAVLATFTRYYDALDPMQDPTQRMTLPDDDMPSARRVLFDEDGQLVHRTTPQHATQPHQEMARRVLFQDAREDGAAAVHNGHNTARRVLFQDAREDGAAAHAPTATTTTTTGAAPPAVVSPPAILDAVHAAPGRRGEVFAFLDRVAADTNTLADGMGPVDTLDLVDRIANAFATDGLDADGFVNAYFTFDS